MIIFPFRKNNVKTLIFVTKSAKILFFWKIGKKKFLEIKYYFYLLPQTRWRQQQKWQRFRPLHPNRETRS